MAMTHIKRLAEHIRKQSTKTVRRYEKRLLQELQQLDPDHAAAVTESCMAEATAKERDFYQQAETIAQALKLAQERDQIDQLRAGSMVGNMVAAAWPDRYRRHPTDHHLEV